MSVSESSDETYKPPKIQESSLDESMDDESFTCLRVIDDEFSSGDESSSDDKSPSDESYMDSGEVDEVLGFDGLTHSKELIILKCQQASSLNGDSEHIFSSDSGASRSRALQDDALSPSMENKSLVGDSTKYPLANKISQIDDGFLEDINDRYLMSKNYTIHAPNDNHRRYDVIKGKKQYGLAISRAQLDCGLRFPIHPFTQKIIDQAGVGLSQLLPNSFLNINAFIDRCLDRGVRRQSPLFWTHFRLLQNKVNNPGFYTIALKPKSQKWVVTPGNYHHAHKEWFFITGPDLKKFSRWQTFDAVSHAPVLSDEEEADYKKLIRPHSTSMVISQRESRSEAYLIDIGVSGLDAKEELLHQRLLVSRQKEEAALKRKKAKKNVQDQDQGRKDGKKRGRENAPDTSTGVSDKELGSQALMITQGGDFLPSDVIHDGNLVNKKVKINNSISAVELPAGVLEKASSSSVSFGKRAKTMLSLPNDRIAVQKYSRGEGFEHMLGHFSQAFSWAIQLSEKDKDADEVEAQLRKLYELEAKKLRTANAKIENIETEIASLKSKVGDLEDQLTNARSNEKRLNDIISAKTKEVETAEEHWYKNAVTRKLKKAKEIFGDDYVGLVDPWDKDPNVEELSPAESTSPSVESQAHDEAMPDDVSKEKTVIEDNPRDHLADNV